MMMHLSENQRFKEAIQALKKLNIIQFSKELAETLETDKFRISYLSKDGGGSMTPQELNILQLSYPQINWNYVITGEGSIIKEDEPIHLVKESAMIYEKTPEHGKLINDILSGLSVLPEHEQKRILIREVLNLQKKVIDVYESTNPLSILKDLKKLLK